MKVNMEKIEKNVVSLEIEVDQEKFREGVEKAYTKISKKVSIPGFRKGKAPRAIIENHVGKDYINEEALEMIVPEVYFAAIQEKGIEPIDKPDVEVVPAEGEKPLILKVKVQVKPEVELGQYIGLEVEKIDSEVTETDIEAELEKLRERHAQLVSLEEGPAELGDSAVIDFEGFIDGVAFGGGAGTEYSLQLGSESFIPGFEEQLVGARIGEDKEVRVTFPENYHSTDLAGKEAVFKVVVKAIKRKELADLDDEFAKDVSEFGTLEELKKDILNRLKEAARQQADNRLKDELVEKALQGSQVEVPDIMIKEKTDYLIQSFSRKLGMQGLNLDDYLKFSNTDMASIQAEYRPAAEKAVKIDLILDAIAAKEKVDVTDEEIEAKIAEMAGRYNSEPGTFRQWLENAGNMEPLKKSIIIDKTIEFLQEKAVVK